MRQEIVDAIAKGALPVLAAQARAQVEAPGNIVELLLGLGFPARDIMDACASVSGLPPAPAAWLRDPRPPSVDGLNAALCRRLGVAPLASVAGRLCFGFSDPQVAKGSGDLGLPSHTAYLALPSDLAKALSLLPLADEGPATTLHAAHPQPTLATKTVSGRGDDDDDDEARTIVAPLVAPTASMLQVPSTAADAATALRPAFTDVARAAARSAPAAHVSQDDGDGFNDPTIASDPFVPDVDPPAASEPVEPDSPTRPKRARPGFGNAAVNTDFDDKTNFIAALSRHNGSLMADQGEADGFDSELPEADADLVAANDVGGSDDALRTEAMLNLPARLSAAQHAADHAAADWNEESVSELRTANMPLQDRARGGTEDLLDLLSAPTLQRSSERSSPSKRGGPGAFAAHASMLQDLPRTAHDATQGRDSEVTSAHAGASAADDDDDATAKSRGAAVVARDAAAPARPPQPAAEDAVEFYVPEPDDAGGSGVFGVAAPVRTHLTFEQSTRPAVAVTDLLQASQERDRLQRIAQLSAIKRYKVERVLGRGGMATVYYAIDAQTGSPVALKVMEPHLSEDAVFVERFKREIRASVNIDHPNVVRIIDSGVEGSTYYMATELVDGGTVAGLAKAANGPLPTALVVPMMSDLFAGLSRAHAGGVVHRDLKPANLMLTSTGVLKIVDFGIGKNITDDTITKTGALFGTPAYMSPEQAQGFDLDARSDLYGAGIVFYELLAGVNPFVGETAPATMMNIARGRRASVYHYNPTVPTAVADLIDALLERDPDKRVRSAEEARKRLAPMATLIKRRAPGALARALTDTAGVVSELRTAEARLHVAHGAVAFEKAPPEPAEAAYRFHCAAWLDPGSPDVAQTLEELTAEYGFRFDAPSTPQQERLLREIDDDPDIAIARQLIDHAASLRSVPALLRFTREALLLAPHDAQLLQRLERVVGFEPCAPFATPSSAAPPSAYPQPAPSSLGAVDQILDETVPARGAKLPPAPGDPAYDAVAAAAADELVAGFADPLEFNNAQSPVSSRGATGRGRRIRERVRKGDSEPEISVPSSPAPRTVQLAPEPSAPFEPAGRSRPALTPSTRHAIATTHKPAGGSRPALIAAGVVVTLLALAVAAAYASQFAATRRATPTPITPD